jgi:hypothetical protein
MWCLRVIGWACLPFLRDLDPTAELINCYRLDLKRPSDLARHALSGSRASRLDQKDGAGRNRSLSGKLPYTQQTFGS